MWNGYPTCWRRSTVRPPASSATKRTSASRPVSNPEKDCGKDRIGSRLNSRARSRVGRDYRPAGAYAFGLRQHRRKFDPDIGRQIDLVDDQEVAAEQPRSSFARNVVATGDVDHKHPPVDEIEREGRSEVVAARFEQDQLKAGKSRLKLIARRDIQGRILADHCMRAGPRVDRGDTCRIAQP